MSPGTYRLLGCIACVVACLMYSSTMVSAQILGSLVPRFQLNFLRFFAQFLVSAFAVSLFKSSIFAFESWCHVVAMCFQGLAYTLMFLLMNLAPVYVPVGNVESIEMVTFIVIVIILDILRCDIKVVEIFCGVVSCVGIVLLLQPDFLFQSSLDSHHLMDMCPCLTSDRVHHTDKPEQCSTHFFVVNNNNNNNNNSDVTSEELSFESLPSMESVVVEVQQESLVLSPSVIGYSMSVAGGALFCVFSLLNQKVFLHAYHFSFIAFWVTFVGSVFSAVMMFATETFVVVVTSTCVGMVTVNAAGSSFSIILVIFSLKHTSAAQFSILSTSSIVVLFIAQMTFLSGVRAVHGNILEYTGVSLIVVACVLEPVYDLLSTKKRNKTDDVTYDVKDDVIDERKPLLQQTSKQRLEANKQDFSLSFVEKAIG